MFRLKYFQLAQKLSRKSCYHHRVGAVVVKKNKILGIGFNKPYKTHPRSTNAYKTIHAELDAILESSKEDLIGADIYIFREGSGNTPRLAKPCTHCDLLLKEVGIKNVFYSVDGGFKLIQLR